MSVFQVRRIPVPYEVVAASAAARQKPPPPRLMDGRIHMRPIVLQNANGPCPLLALVNTLLIRGEVRLPKEKEIVLYEELEELVLEALQARVNEQINAGSAPRTENASAPAATVSATPRSASDARVVPVHGGSGAARASGSAAGAQIASALHALEDARALLPKIEHGMDVNLRFSGSDAFEFTPAIGVFDLAGVRMLHGWVYDPQDAEAAQAFGSMSYNQTVEFVTKEVGPTRLPEQRASSGAAAAAAAAAAPEHTGTPEEKEDEEEKLEVLAPSIEVLAANANIARRQAKIRQWLSDNASQLTVIGLASLHTQLEKGELAVLFRNNHFHVITKHSAHLYVLVTDIGLLSAAPGIVWQRLAYVDGDDAFVGSDFLVPADATIPADVAALQAAEMEASLIEQERRYADQERLAYEQQYHGAVRHGAAPPRPPRGAPPPDAYLADQQRQQMIHAAARSDRDRRQRASEDDGDCVIL